MDRDDIRVVQPREKLPLALEAARKRGIALRQRGGQQLERDEPVQLRLARLKNPAHAALPDEFEDFKLRESRLHSFNGGRRLRAWLRAMARSDAWHLPSGSAGIARRSHQVLGRPRRIRSGWE